MKRSDNIAYKKKTIDNFCRHRRCRECPLVITRYCQLGDKSPNAIKEAYDVYIKNPHKSNKRCKHK